MRELVLAPAFWQVQHCSLPAATAWLLCAPTRTPSALQHRLNSRDGKLAVTGDDQASLDGSQWPLCQGHIRGDELFHAGDIRHPEGDIRQTRWDPGPNSTSPLLLA